MSMSDPTDNNLLPSNGSSPEPSAQKSDLTPTELHDGDVLARFRHLPPLEADASLYIMARDSQKAHLELLERFLLFCRRGSVLPAADAAHAVQTLTELAEQKRKGFRQWKARQASRKSNAGRPSSHAQGEEQALALEALAADVVPSAVINVTAHRLAFELIEAERDKYALQLKACRERGEPPPRRTRGRRTNNAQKFNMAMDVQVELEAHPDWSENRAIHKVAKAWHKKHDDADHSARDANYRENMIERWHKKIEASYYERKPYLRSTKEPRLDGMIPLELVLDD